MPKELVPGQSISRVLSSDDDDGLETLVVAHGGHQGSELDLTRAGTVDERPQGAARLKSVVVGVLWSCRGVGRGGPQRWLRPARQIVESRFAISVIRVEGDVRVLAVGRHGARR